MILKMFRNMILTLWAVMFCCGFIVAGKGYDIYKEAVEETSIQEMVEEIRSQESYTEYEELPEDYVNAVVAVEDKRFFRHFGLDPIAICRAVLNDLRAGSFVEGGSTITQQLAKNMYFNQDKELTRKAAEAFLALDLEKTYSKEEIFELYVNSIYFGDGYYDVASASEGYFDKEPDEMTEYESTLLAGIPNAPSAYAPTRNPELAAKRQMQVIKRMAACGYFSEEETDAVNETVAETLAALASAE